MHSAANTFSREISRHFDSYFSEYDLATSYVELVLILYDKEELSQNELAEEMKLAPSTITRFVKKLVKEGLLKKSKSGRTSIVSLSKKGNDLAPELKEKYNRAEQDLDHILGNKYVHTTRELLLHGSNLLQTQSEE